MLRAAPEQQPAARAPKEGAWAPQPVAAETAVLRPSPQQAEEEPARQAPRAEAAASAAPRRAPLVQGWRTPCPEGEEALFFE